jgi:hypothetical protein
VSSPNAPSPPLSSAVCHPGAIVRCTIDTIAGDAKPDATAEKETGHSASAPSLLQGYKKLEGMFRTHPWIFRAVEG